MHSGLLAAPLAFPLGPALPATAIVVQKLRFEVVLPALIPSQGPRPLLRIPVSVMQDLSVLLMCSQEHHRIERTNWALFCPQPCSLYGPLRPGLFSPWHSCVAPSELGLLGSVSFYICVPGPSGHIGGEIKGTWRSWPLLCTTGSSPYIPHLLAYLEKLCKGRKRTLEQAEEMVQ